MGVTDVDRIAAYQSVYLVTISLDQVRYIMARFTILISQYIWIHLRLSAKRSPLDWFRNSIEHLKGIEGLSWALDSDLNLKRYMAR